MITVVGGYVKLVNQVVELVDGELELSLYAKMFYATRVAKDELSKSLYRLGYYDNSVFAEDDSDVRVKKMTIDPFEEVMKID